MYAYDAYMPSPLLDSEIVAELVRARRIEDGQRLQKRRVALHLTQAQVADLAGMNISSVCRVESGTYTPRDDHKVALATALAQEITDIWVPLRISEVRARAIELAAA